MMTEQDEAFLDSYDVNTRAQLIAAICRVIAKLCLAGIFLLIIVRYS